jgi:glycosyltransferase involved in cell wall biosynthesis
MPLVVGDTGGLAEFVTEPRGRRCRPNDPDELAGQILAALADPVDTCTAARRRVCRTGGVHVGPDRRVALERGVRAHPPGRPPPQAFAAPPNPVL